MKLTGWGRYPVVDAHLTAPRDEAALAAAIRRGGAIARGNGRAYGDSAVSRHNTLRMKHFDRMLAFDGGSGQLVAEAGVLLADIIATFLPRGWFPAVTPGTKFVTLGGMLAADVHGKNHHREGAMRSCVDWIEVMDSNGTVRRFSRAQEPELFDWTLGGMGLTGVILRAAIRLRPVESGWLWQTTKPASDLEAAMQAFEDSAHATYSVAWIDCLSRGRALGRSLVMLGDHALPDELPDHRRADLYGKTRRRPVALPLDAPSFLLHGALVRAFNQYYYWNGARRKTRHLVHWDEFFYPLDTIEGWNRIYGRRGFVQFQCVLPLDRAHDGLAALLDATSRSRRGSFLAVLKRLGEEAGRFSFPMPGYTLALDFPLSRRTLALVSQLDQITLEHGGRFYLAKDARMAADTLAASDGRAQEFARMRMATGLAAGFRSAQSERLAL